MDFLSGRRVEDLFENNSFLNAIRRKDVHEVKGKIREVCDFHIEGELSSPLIKLAKTEWPNRYKKQRQGTYRRFNSDIRKLTTIIIESGLGILTESEIDPEPLISAIRQNQSDVVKFYFWIGGSPHLKTKIDHKKQCGGKSLIHYAAGLDDNDIILLMIENGADPNSKSFYGMETPIHLATAAGNQIMVRMLWGCGADIDSQRHDGETALMIATKNSDPEMVYLLARLGADVKIVNSKGQTALDLAKIHGSEIIIEMIAERKAGIEFPMIEGFVSFDSASNCFQYIQKH